MFALFLTMQTCNKHMKASNNLAEAVAHANDTARIWKDRYGREHADRMLIVGDHATIDAIKGQLLDSVSKALGTNKKNIGSISAASITSGNEVTGRVDTVYLPGNQKTAKLSYIDRWIDIEALASNPPKLKYSTFDSIIITTYSKKTGWFKRAIYVDGYSINPHSRITGITALKIEEIKNKHFCIGPYIGFGFNGTQWKPSVGLSLQYFLIKF
jgi:hypothetical protein